MARKDEVIQEYFRHDYNARSGTRKIKRFVRKQGMKGLGIYWCLVEMLYEDNGYIPVSEYGDIADDLDVDVMEIKDVVEAMFYTDGEAFWSNTVLDRLAHRAEKRELSRGAANVRWNQEREKKGEPPKLKESETIDISELDITEANEKWSLVKEELKSQVSASNYRTWIEETIGVFNNGTEFTIGVRNPYIANYLENNQRSLIEKTLIGQLGKEVSVIFKVVKGGERDDL